jgi:hypothetical protein
MTLYSGLEKIKPMPTIFFFTPAATMASDQTAPTKDQRIIHLESQVSELSRRLQDTQSRLDQQYQQSISISQVSTSNIANMLTAGSISLAVFAFLLTIGSVGLALLVKNYYEKIRDISKTSLRQFELMDKFDKDIKNNMSNIYHGLQREEIEYIFRKLQSVPDDISHHVTKLLSVDLSPRYYNVIKDIYFQARDQPQVSGQCIEDLFFVMMSHFLDQAMFDTQVYPLIANEIRVWIRGFFDNDFKKLLPPILNHYISKDIPFDEKMLVLAGALQVSSFMKSDPIIDLFNETLGSRRADLITFLAAEPELAEFVQRLRGPDPSSLDKETPIPSLSPPLDPAGTSSTQAPSELVQAASLPPENQ